MSLLQALGYEPPKDALDEARQFRTVSLSTQLRLACARRRVGRGGRVWIDRSSVHLPRLLEAAELNGTAVVPGPELVRGRRTVHCLARRRGSSRRTTCCVWGATAAGGQNPYRDPRPYIAEDDEDLTGLVDPSLREDAVVPFHFMSVGLPCYTPQDLAHLNGTPVDLARYGAAAPRWTAGWVSVALTRRGINSCIVLCADGGAG